MSTPADVKPVSTDRSTTKLRARSTAEKINTDDNAICRTTKLWMAADLRTPTSDRTFWSANPAALTPAVARAGRNVNPNAASPMIAADIANNGPLTLSSADASSSGGASRARTFIPNRLPATPTPAPRTDSKTFSSAASRTSAPGPAPKAFRIPTSLRLRVHLMRTPGARH